MTQQGATDIIAIEKPGKRRMSMRWSAWLRLVVRSLFLLVSFCLGGLIMGLVFFTGYVLFAKTSVTSQQADAIVVVTGGSGRLEEAMALLERGQGGKLLVSGVHPNYTQKTLSYRHKSKRDLIACCVELDSAALNTVANATQTALWVKRNGFNRLIVVTSAYHMPRTILEMRRASPATEFIPHIVVTNTERSIFSRLIDSNNMHLLTKEYGKLLAALFYISTERLAPADL